MKTFQVLDEDIYNILGRGLVFVLHDSYANDFNLGETIELNGSFYEIKGIEARKGLFPLKGIGLNVMKL